MSSMGRKTAFSAIDSAAYTRAAEVADARTGSAKNGRWWGRLHDDLHHHADNAFYRLGYWVSTHAKLTVFISVVLVVVCSSGFVNFEIETDGEDIWVPRDSVSKKQEKVVLEHFDDSDEFAVFLMEAPSEDGSVLTKASIDALWEIHALVLGIETNGQTYTDLCVKELDGAACNQPLRGMTRFWGNSFEAYNASVTTDADVLTAVNIQYFRDGQAVSLDAMFGNSATYDSSGALTGARAMLQTYELVRSADDDAAINDVVRDWQADFQDLMLEEVGSFSAVFNVVYRTSRSLDDALEESVSGEIYLFAITYIIMSAFATIVLSRFCSGPVHRRAWLGLGGVAIVVSAGLAAYGLNSAFGVPFTALSKILPFILIGIGVDDMFVIVSAFDHTDPALPVEERVALGVKRCGVSIAYTSLTNFFAFMLGSITAIPAVEYFCLYAGIAILFDFFLQMTAFVALLAMDANRQEAGKTDWLSCGTNKTSLKVGSARRAAPAASPNDIREVGKGTSARRISAEIRQFNCIEKFMKEKYAPFLVSTKGKALVLLGSAALLAAGVYGVTQSTEDFDLLDLAPDDHYARDYMKVADLYELDIIFQYIPLGIYTREVDYPDVGVQAQIQATDEGLKGQRFIVGPPESWLGSFLAWAANDTDYSVNMGTSGGYPVYNDRGTFYTALTEFTADGANARFQSDIVYTDDGEIEISRTWLFLIDVINTDNSIGAIRQTREVVEQSTLNPQPFGFNVAFVFIEQFLVVYQELIANFLLALAAIAALSLLVLGKISIVILVCLTVVMIDIELLGFVHHWGLDVNSITVIELIMAVGLVVDYMVHIVHYFLHQDPSISKDARIADALGEIGPSVMNGATTTFLGIIPLAFANNVIFRVFFKMFLIIIGFGFYHGVAFIPVALSILPDWVVSEKSASSSRQDREAGIASDLDLSKTVTVRHEEG